LETAHYLADYQYFAEKQLWIIDKLSHLTRLIYNHGQRKINQAIEDQKIRNKPVRIVLLKGRQFGGSTKIEGDLANETLLREGRSSLIVAHSLESAEHIRSMSERFYERYTLPKPKLKKQTEKWWKFLHKRGGKNIESSLRIDTAENLAAGHSFTLHNLHLSEIQAWPHAEEIVKGLFPTVPNSPDTMVFMEGTGAGVGSYWYDSARWPRPESLSGRLFSFPGMRLKTTK